MGELMLFDGLFDSVDNCGLMGLVLMGDWH